MLHHWIAFMSGCLAIVGVLFAISGQFGRHRGILLRLASGLAFALVGFVSMTAYFVAIQVPLEVMLHGGLILFVPFTVQMSVVGFLLGDTGWPSIVRWTAARVGPDNVSIPRRLLWMTGSWIVMWLVMWLCVAGVSASNAILATLTCLLVGGNALYYVLRKIRALSNDQMVILGACLSVLSIVVAMGAEFIS